MQTIFCRVPDQAPSGCCERRLISLDPGRLGIGSKGLRRPARRPIMRDAKGGVVGSPRTARSEAPGERAMIDTESVPSGGSASGSTRRQFAKAVAGAAVGALAAPAVLRARN